MGETLCSYNITVFNSNLNTVKIQQDQFRCHRTFKQREKGTQLSNTKWRLKQWGSNHCTKKAKKRRGPRAVKSATKCQARSQARYKQQNGIIKVIHHSKVVAGDDSLISFLKHPVDGSTDEWMIYETRGYFRNWGQHLEDTKKGTLSLQKSLKRHLQFYLPLCS